MIEIKSRWKSVTDREKWAARGAAEKTTDDTSNVTSSGRPLKTTGAQAIMSDGLGA
jgi:hypothetical protein